MNFAQLQERTEWLCSLSEDELKAYRQTLPPSARQNLPTYRFCFAAVNVYTLLDYGFGFRDNDQYNHTPAGSGVDDDEVKRINRYCAIGFVLLGCI